MIHGTVEIDRVITDHMESALFMDFSGYRIPLCNMGIQLYRPLLRKVPLNLPDQGPGIAFSPSVRSRFQSRQK